MAKTPKADLFNLIAPAEQVSALTQRPELQRLPADVAALNAQPAKPDGAEAPHYCGGH